MVALLRCLGVLRVVAVAMVAMVAVTATGCGDNLLPAEVAGESTHFRFWLDRSLTLPAGVTTADVLAALEANFADVQTMLHMPEGRGKIDYYWLTDEHIQSHCPTQPGESCQYGEGGGTILSTTYYPYDHELIHAYASLLFTPHKPPLVLAEGLAEAIGCVRGPFSVHLEPEDRWQNIVTAHRPDVLNVYRAGMLLVRYLILNYGIERFLPYYGSAPRTNNPGVFSHHFAAYWGRDLEEVWAAMQMPSAPRGPPWVRPICPCGRTPLALPPPLHSAPLNRSLAAPYWTLPDLGGETLVVESHSGVTWGDCRQELINYAPRRLLFTSVSSPDYLLTAYDARMVRGPYVTTSCDELTTLPYDLPADLIDPFGDSANVRLAFDGTQPSPTGAYVVYMNWRPRTRVLVLPRNSPVPQIAACATCDFSAAECQFQPMGQILEPGMPYHIKVSVRATSYVPTMADISVSAPP